MRHWRVLICPFILLGAMTCSQAEGNYDPFNSKNPEERAQAARMREAIEKDDWKGAEKNNWHSGGCTNRPGSNWPSRQRHQ